MTKLPALINRVRKALIVAVPAVGLIVGTDTVWYVKALAVLVAAGVYAVPNAA